MTERNLNLVVPLAHEANAMRTAETGRRSADRSGAVTQLSNRSGDVESTIGAPTRGIRTSTTVTRTTTTRTTTIAAPAQSADSSITFVELVESYFDCRRTKRNTASALAFEVNLENNLRKLYDELIDGSYKPGRSICFVITRPKPREVWAADFRDRIVHHLLYRRIGPRFERSFIADSCACIKGRGTLYAAKRLESKVRSITQNWSKRAFYLKMDIASFFVGISQSILWDLLSKKIADPWWSKLVRLVVFHDPRQDFEFRGERSILDLVPRYKRLLEQPDGYGLPIGNLSSQFFANVYLNEVDQFVKHRLKIRHYCRYVDDMIFLHESTSRLNEVRAAVTEFLPANLDLQINPKKTILQPIDLGVDFVGQVVRPWRRETRKRTVRAMLERINVADDADIYASANSYFGLLRQATANHADRAMLATAVLQRGLSVNGDLIKAYRNRR